jgi:hypothetical protein
MQRLRRLAAHVQPPQQLGGASAASDPVAAAAAAPHAPDVDIDGQAVVTTSLGGLPPSSEETQRLLDALLRGSGYFIAKGVLPPALAEHCRTVALTQGEQPEYENGLKRRVMGLLDADPEAFSDVLLRTETALGPVLRAIMGGRAFLNSWHSFTLYPERREPGKPPYRAAKRSTLNDFEDDELRREQTSSSIRKSASADTKFLLLLLGPAAMTP